MRHPLLHWWRHQHKEYKRYCLRPVFRTKSSITIGVFTAGVIAGLVRRTCAEAV